MLASVGDMVQFKDYFTQEDLDVYVNAFRKTGNFLNFLAESFKF